MHSLFFKFLFLSFVPILLFFLLCCKSTSTLLAYLLHLAVKLQSRIPVFQITFITERQKRFRDEFDFFVTVILPDK